MQLVNHLTDTQLKTLPDFKPGYTVRVHQKVIDIITDPKSGKVTGKKERAQVFEGLVIAKKNGKGITGTFIVRKISSGVGVERIFPLHSQNIVKLEVVKQPVVTKAKLYYVRGRQDNSPRVRKFKAVKKVEINK